MYVWKEIKDELFDTEGMVDSDPEVAYYDVVDKFCRNFIAVINEELEKIYNENAPLIGRFKINILRVIPKWESKVILATPTKQSMYYIDFYITSTTYKGEFRSLDYRMEFDVQKGGVMFCGVLENSPGDENGYPPSSIYKGTWKFKRMRKEGMSGLFSKYSISIRPTYSNTKLLLSLSNDWRSITGRVYVLVTDTNLLIFTHRDKYPTNLISFLYAQDVLDEKNGIRVMYSNGWASWPEFLEKGHKIQTYMYNSFYRTSSIQKIWLRDLLIYGTGRRTSEGDTKDIRLYFPNIYITNEHCTQHTVETRTVYVDTSSGLLQEPVMWIGYVGTFLTGLRYLLAVR